MSGLEESLDRIAFDGRFSGVVRVDRGGAIEFADAYGFADRRHRIPNRMDTQFGIASGVKGLTALTVMTLVQEGRLELATTARSILGQDLPLIRRFRDRRASPHASVGHRRLLRRGDRATDHRPRADGSTA
jgi:CubicO group peptidase (beta-lactamase class C family)